MKLYLWRHNRKFHSYSMIEEPCVHQDFYTAATAAVLASSLEEALDLLAKEGNGWRIEDLRKLSPEVFDCQESGLVLQRIEGS
ncbi:MAG: hypothetical protein E6713_14390 [Sporomusaceae bacterium]|nr:hypothetical protein [Sporomusaceae bacterium]